MLAFAKYRKLQSVGEGPLQRKLAFTIPKI